MLKGLLIASLIGSCIFVIFALLKPLTKRRFNCTWHYYAHLIPTFFLCGGLFLLSPLFKAMTNRFGIVPITMQTEAVTRPIVSAPPPLIRMPVTESNGVDIDLIIMVCTVVWALVAFLFIAVQVFRFVEFRHNILSASKEVDTEIKGVRTLICDGISTPILIGIFRPTVIFPNIELTADERSMILTHELIHKKRGDLVVKLIVMLVNAAHWFNPLAYMLTSEISRYCEASCDECVVRTLNVEQRKQYGGAILSIMHYASSSPFYTGFSMSKDSLKGRLVSIMQFEKSKKTVIIISLAVAGAVLAAGGIIAFSMGIGQDKDNTNVDFTAATSSNTVSSDYKADDGMIVGTANTNPDGTENIIVDTVDPEKEPVQMLIPFTDDVDYRISAPYGERELISGTVLHDGVDLAAEQGSKIVASADGIVTFSGWNEGYGLQIVVDHGNGVITEYNHCSKLLSRTDDTVKAGDTIALVGSTGNSTGNHLHFGIKFDGDYVDPSTLVPLATE